MPRQRIQPTPAQLKHARKLLEKVSVQTRREWSSPDGQEFLAYVEELRNQGVAVAWVADELDLIPSVLYDLLNRPPRGEVAS